MTAVRAMKSINNRAQLLLGGEDSLTMIWNARNREWPRPLRETLSRYGEVLTCTHILISAYSVPYSVARARARI